MLLIVSVVLVKFLPLRKPATPLRIKVEGESSLVVGDCALALMMVIKRQMKIFFILIYK